jgi:hypothetical protein
MTRPLRLTDEQLGAILRASQPLTPIECDRFLRELAITLAGYREIGDGQLYLAIREVQRKHFDPPRLDHTPRPSIAK